MQEGLIQIALSLGTILSLAWMVSRLFPSTPPIGKTAPAPSADQLLDIWKYSGGSADPGPRFRDEANRRTEFLGAWIDDRELACHGFI
jgi:hypothetical protein